MEQMSGTTVYDPVIIDDVDEAVHDPLIEDPMGEQQDVVSDIESEEPELQEENSEEELEEMEGTEPIESCLTCLTESRTSLACSLCACKVATHGDLCQACWKFDQLLDKYIEDHCHKVYASHRGTHSGNPIILSDDEE